MNIYLITDTHFFHDKMVEFCGRPKNFTEVIGNNLMACDMQKEDIFIHLGDVCMGHDEEAHKSYIQPLKAHKWLVRGNHDKKSTSWYLENGWDFVCDHFYDTFFGKKILFSHYPMAWDGYHDLNIHGHFHNTDHRRHEPQFESLKNGYQKLLAIEYTKYQPVNLEKFIKMV
jgi:calcineurin-like phosphoesterase family protein